MRKNSNGADSSRTERSERGSAIAVTALRILPLMLAAAVLFIMYGPWKKLSDLYITTAMHTSDHKWLATAIYPDGYIEKVMERNAVVELAVVALLTDLREVGIKGVADIRGDAQALCKGLMSRDIKIVSNGTDNHLMLLDLRGKYPEVNGRIAETQLVKADITVNKNMVPFDTRSAFQTSGLRIGTPAITSRGFVEKDMATIVGLIDEVLASCAKNIEALSLKKDEVPTEAQAASLAEHESVIKSVQTKVHSLTAGVPLNRY